MSEHSKDEMSNPITATEEHALIQEPVAIKVTVRDVEEAVIQNAKVAVFLMSDRTKVLDNETDASGIASTTYAGPTPAEVEIRCRKPMSEDSPRYVNYSCKETIKSDTGLNFDLMLTKDINFNKPPH